jgi:hypothetical protein
MKGVRITFLLSLLLCAHAYAAETLPGDACTVGETDLYRHSGGPENPGTGYLLVCNGSNWRAVQTWDSATGKSLFQVNNDGGACSATILGRIRYNGTSTWEYCNGTGWTNLLSGAAGTPAAPDRSIQFNSGGAFTGSTNLVYTSAGRLGNGTSTPSSKLHVEFLDAATTRGTSNSFILSNNNGTAGNISGIAFPQIIVGGTSLFGAGIYAHHVDRTSGARVTDLAFHTLNTTQAERMRITGAGNVGIGTSNPLTLLHVWGGNVAAGSHGMVRFQTNDTSGINVGPSLAFRGYSNGTTTENTFGEIAGRKEAADAGTRGYLQFSTNSGSVTEAMRITSNGYVYIGGIPVYATAWYLTKSLSAVSGYARGGHLSTTLTATQNNDELTALRIEPTFVNGSYTGIQNNGLIVTSGNVGIGTATPAVKLDVVGDIYYTGVIADVSDRRKKENIQSLGEEQLKKIHALRPVSFIMKGDGQTELGFIAQDVEAIYPELVRTTSDGTKTMNYIGLTGPMVAAIKEQQSQIEELKERLQKLEENQCQLNQPHERSRSYNQ